MFSNLIQTQNIKQAFDSLNLLSPLVQNNKMVDVLDFRPNPIIVNRFAVTFPEIVTRVGYVYRVSGQGYIFNHKVENDNIVIINSIDSSYNPTSVFVMTASIEGGVVIRPYDIMSVDASWLPEDIYDIRVGYSYFCNVSGNLIVNGVSYLVEQGDLIVIRAINETPRYVTNIAVQQVNIELGSIDKSIIPKTNNVYNIGSNVNKFNSIFSTNLFSTNIGNSSNYTSSAYITDLNTTRVGISTPADLNYLIKFSGSNSGFNNNGILEISAGGTGRNDGFSQGFVSLDTHVKFSMPTNAGQSSLDCSFIFGTKGGTDMYWFTRQSLLQTMENDGITATKAKLGNRVFTWIDGGISSPSDFLTSGVSGFGYTPIQTMKTFMNLNNVDNTSDINKPISTAMQNALNLKSPLLNPVFTGTVTAPTFSGNLLGNATTSTNATNHINNASNPHGVTKAQVGLSVVDNTADVNKYTRSSLMLGSYNNSWGYHGDNSWVIKANWNSIYFRLASYGNGNDTTPGNQCSVQHANIADSVNGYSIWVGTEAQYNAIGKNDQTLYFVK